MGNFQTLRSIAELLNLIIKLMVIMIKQQNRSDDVASRFLERDSEIISSRADSIVRW